MSRNGVVGSWQACRNHDKVLRKMMNARKKLAMDSGTTNGQRFVRLTLQCVSAPAVLHASASHVASSADPFDARLLLGAGGAGGGGGVGAGGSHTGGSSRLTSELDFFRYASLVVAEAEENDEVIKTVESSHSRPVYLLPTQEELLKAESKATAQQTQPLPQQPPKVQQQSPEQRGEQIAARYGLRNFFSQLRVEEAREREDAESKGKRRSSSGAMDSSHRDRVRMRDEDMDEEEDEEEQEDKKQKVEEVIEPEPSEESADNAFKRMQRMIASQLSAKREADLHEEERRR
jgi:hypothetical protein